MCSAYSRSTAWLLALMKSAGELPCRHLRRLALEQARHPRLASRVLARHSHNRSRTDDQKLAKIAIALLGYSAEQLFAA
jgi:hypothetical protein